MFHSMLVAYAILILCNVVTEALSNIAQEKIQHCTAMQAMSSEQHLVTLFAYVYITSFKSKKYEIIPSLLQKLAETKAETGAQNSTQQPVKPFVRSCLKK